MAHERFANQECIESGGAEAFNVFAGVNSALGHTDRIGGQPVHQPKRCLEAYCEGGEVAIVDSISIATQGPHTFQFLGGMYLAKDIKSQTMRLLGESAKFSV
jgi:hypothetical protein